MTPPLPQDTLSRPRLFTVGLLAIFTIGFAFATRAATATALRADLFDGFAAANAGELLGGALGAAFAGFAVTLLVVSAALDRIGMRRALIAAAAALIVGVVLVIAADRLAQGPAIYRVVWAGMVVQGIGWGLVEATVNPMTAALYPEDRTHRLNVVHAWWPAGLIAGGLTGLGLDALGVDWRVTFCLIALPAIAFAVLAAGLRFPATERAAAGVPASAMWGEIGRSPLILLWIGLMMLTASSELAPGQWVDFALSRIVGMRGILLLVYIAALMFVMRHFAGPLSHRLSNTGLLAVSALLAALGLWALSRADSPVTALLAATIWGMGVCFMWPTMLASVAERFPRGGSLFLGLMGAAGAGSVWIVLPYLGRVYDAAKLDAAGGETAFASLAGPALERVLSAAATASFETVALIPAALAIIFGAMRLVESRARR